MLSQRANSYQGKGEPGLSSRLPPAQRTLATLLPKMPGPTPLANTLASSKECIQNLQSEEEPCKQKGHIWSEWDVLLCQAFSPLPKVFSTVKMGSVLGLTALSIFHEFLFLHLLKAYESPL